MSPKKSSSMFAFRSVVVLLALLTYTRASQCGEDSYGSRSGTEYPLLPVQFVEHQVQIVLNSNPLPCPEETVVGTWVEACSEDSLPPTVTFLSKFVALVTRNGQELGAVTVNSSVFCVQGAALGAGLGSASVGAPKVVVVGKN